MNRPVKINKEGQMKKVGLVCSVAFLAMAIMFPNGAKAAKGFYISAGAGLGIPAMSGDFNRDAKPAIGDALELLDVGYGFDKNWAVGLDWGAAAGGADEDFLGKNAIWGQGYMGLYGRYNFDKGQQFVPYVDLGVGDYVFDAVSDDLSLVTDNSGLGIKIGVGANYFIGRSQRFYVAPEISYHYVTYNTEAKVDPKHYHDFKIDFDDNASMVLVLIKIGYQWKQSPPTPLPKNNSNAN